MATIHGSKYLKPEVTGAIMYSVREKVLEYVDCPEINDAAEAVAGLFLDLNEKYSQVHVAVSHARPIPDEHIDSIQDKIDCYMEFYRNHFPGQVIPKQHFLEDHIIPWIRRYHFGLGLLGEQGGESVHSEFNQLAQNARCIKRDKDRLMSMMRVHHTKVNPHIQSQCVKPKQYKK